MSKALFAALLMSLPLSAAAQQAPAPVQPTASGAFWIDPSTGCSYARAEVPGWPPTWHLIRNGAQIGLTNARRGCAATLRATG